MQYSLGVKELDTFCIEFEDVCALRAKRRWKAGNLLQRARDFESSPLSKRRRLHNLLNLSRGKPKFERWNSVGTEEKMCSRITRAG